MNKKIKILNVLSPMTIAGAERVVLLIEKLLDRNMFEFKMCILLNADEPINEFTKEIEKRNINAHKIFLKKIFEINQVKKLVSIIKKQEIDIIHTHGHRADITGYLANIICKKKIISTIHGWTPVSRKVQFYEKIESILLRKFDCIIAVSHKIEKSLIDLKINKNKIKIIHNSIDFNYLDNKKKYVSLRKEKNIKKDDKVIGTICRLSKEKGLEFLIKAAKKVCENFKNVKFVIVGDGPQKKELIELRNKLGVENDIIFTGFRNDIENILKDIDIFVLPSLSEGIPISLLEASYFKKPIISTNVGGIPELLGDDIELINPGKENEIFKKISLYLNDEEEAKRDGIKIHEIISKKCQNKEWISKIQKVYVDIM